MTENETCGAKTGNGNACELPPSRPDGRCHHHTEAVTQQRGGRDPKLTKSRQENIASEIEHGRSIASACRQEGITEATFYNWMDRGEGQGEGIYADFFERITRARGIGEDHYVSALLEIAKENGDTATLMSMLKQRYPDAWGNVDRGEQAGAETVINIPDSVAEKWERAPNSN